MPSPRPSSPQGSVHAARRMMAQSLTRWLAAACLFTAAVLVSSPALAQRGPSIPGAPPVMSTLDPALAARLKDSVVFLRVEANDNAVSSETLGTERGGTGVLIGPNTVLTVGYLLLEAERVQVMGPDGKVSPATRVGYDQATGLGVVRTLLPIKGTPLELGDSDKIEANARLLTIGAGEPEAFELGVISREAFIAPWEYALDRAIYTFPPVNNWSGAALVNGEGKLVGIGSMLLERTRGSNIPGNMYVPTDLVKPLLKDLVERGRASGPARGWLGMSVQETAGNLIVSRVTRGSPADGAGIRQGDILLGVAGQKVDDLQDYYRKLWAAGPAGTEVTLRMLVAREMREIKLRSIDRADFNRARDLQ